MNPYRYKSLTQKIYLKQDKNVIILFRLWLRKRRRQFLIDFYGGPILTRKPNKCLECNKRSKFNCLCCLDFYHRFSNITKFGHYIIKYFDCGHYLVSIKQDGDSLVKILECGCRSTANCGHVILYF